MEKIKILFVAFGHPFSGKKTGGTKRFIELLQYYSKNDNYSVTLLSLENKEDIPLDITTVTLEGYITKTWVLPPSIKIYKKNKLLISNIFKKNNIIIGFDVTTIYWLTKSKSKNLVLMIRKDLIAYRKIELDNYNIPKYFKKIILLIYGYAERKSLLKSKLVIVQCNYDRDQLLKRHKAIKYKIQEKIIVQMNNINPSWIVENSFSKSYINKSEKTERIKIAFIGDFDNSRKGHGILLDALTEIEKKSYKFELLIFGGGKMCNFYKDKYTNNENYYFLGYIKNPIPMLKQCDVLIVPSLADSFPNTIMEALYNEIPVIGSNVGGIPEILNDADALFEPNKESLEDKIINAIDTNLLYGLIKNQINRKKELIFDWPEKIDSIIVSYFGIYS